MKLLSVSLCAFAASSALAFEPCATKQKNAASYELAQVLGVAVQGVEVLAYEHGAWTEAVGNNVGSDAVTVRAGNRTNRGMTIKKYRVSGKQIGDSGDCNITGIELDERE